MARREPLPEPIDFGKYQLIERIARGRMGEVFKAKRGGVEGFEKVLVVKKLNPQLTASEHFVNTFVEEAKLTVSLSHANIVQVMDLGQQQGVYFMAMEHVAGYDLGTVRRVLHTGGRPFPLDIAVFTISEVAKGLDYAHRRKDYNFESLNIVHRDLSPANILVSYEGEVKITDFGISRALEVVGATGDNVRRQFLYASPEQARGEQMTHRSDIYSLGLILYELVSGLHPYNDPDPRVVQRRSMEGTVRPIRQVVELPKALEQIITSSLFADPNQRVDSAGTLYEELISYLFASGHKADNRSLSLFMQDVKQLEEELFQQNIPIQQTTEGLPEADMEGIIELDPDQLEMLESGSDIFEMSGMEAGAAEVRNSLVVPDRAGPVATAMEIPVVRLPQRQEAGSRFDPVSQPDAMPQRISQLADGLRAGQGGSVLLVGELGSGRDFLPDRLSARLKSRGLFQVLQVVMVDDDRTVPYRLATDLIRYVAGLEPDGRLSSQNLDQASELQAVQRMSSYGLSWEEVDMAVNLCGLVDTYQKGFHAKRDLTLGLISRLMRAATAENPFVIILDGVERLDPLSRDLLFHLCGMTRQLPLLLLCSTATDQEAQALLGIDHEERPALEGVQANVRQAAVDEAAVVSAMEPQGLALLTALCLANQPLPMASLEGLLGLDEEGLQALVDGIAPTGALRLVPPAQLHLGSERFGTVLSQAMKSHQLPHQSGMASRLLVLGSKPIAWLSPWSWSRMRLLVALGKSREALNHALRYGEKLCEDGWREVALTHYTQMETLLSRSAYGTPQIRLALMTAKARVALELMQINMAASTLGGLWTLAEQARDEELLLEVRCVEADLSLVVGETPRALNLLRSVIDSATRGHLTRPLIRARLLMAEWMLLYGDLYLAQEHLEALLGQIDAFGAECVPISEQAEALSMMVEVLARRGHLARGVSTQVHLEQLTLSSGSAMMSCLASLGRAHLARANGQPEAGANEAEDAYNTAREHNFIRLGLRLALLVARASLESGDVEKTKAYASHLAELGTNYGHVYVATQGSHLSSLSLVLTSTGDSAMDALQQLHGILNQAQGGQDARAHLHAHHLLYRALNHLGSGRDAEHHRREALRYADLCHAEGLSAVLS